MNITCPCHTCSEKIEFAASDAGQTVTCPHCGVDTVLFIPRSPQPVSPSTRAARKTRQLRVVIACVIGTLLIAALGAWTGLLLVQTFAAAASGILVSLLVAAWVLLCLLVLVVIVMWILFPLFVYRLLKQIETNTRPA